MAEPHFGTTLQQFGLFLLFWGCAKKPQNISKIMLKIMKNDVPRPPKIHKKTSSEKRREKKLQKIRFSFKMMKNWSPMDPKGGPRGLPFSCFFDDFSFWGPGGSQTPSPGCPRGPQGSFFHDFLRFRDRFFWCFRDKKTWSTTLAKQAF